MGVLVTGSKGYIGSVLVDYLTERSPKVSGLDSGLFETSRLEPCPKDSLTIQKDIRHVVPEDLAGVSTVIHLAALSNDPLGALRPELTSEINHFGAIQLAQAAKEAGVKRFIFLSTQSIYGISDPDGPELDEERSEKTPLTAYAKTKFLAEQDIQRLHSDDFFVVVLRPATVFGYSPRLRTDIVFNNLVAQAHFRGEINLTSDGRPWRPVIHVKDLCMAISQAAELPKSQIASRVYNVGVEGGNYTVLQLAQRATELVPGSRLTFSSEATPDERSYRVSFARIYHELAFRPVWTLPMGGRELIDKWDELGCTAEQILGPRTIRLAHLEERQRLGSLDEKLYPRT